MFVKLVACLRDIKDGKSTFDVLPAAFWDETLWDEDFYLELTKFHWSAIKHIPNPLITQEICVAAVTQDPMALQFVPATDQTESLCRLATSIKISAISFVAKEYKSLLLEDWWQQYGSSPDDILELPVSMRDYHAYLRAVKINPQSIRHVPIKLHTEEICDAYLTGGDHDHYLEEVPPEMRSRNLCLASLRRGQGPLDAVPKMIWGPDMVEADRIGQSKNGIESTGL